MGISVVLLAYKEAENLAFLLPKIKEMLDSLPEPYEILVIARNLMKYSLSTLKSRSIIHRKYAKSSVQDI